ncbi:hypothetical protein PIB30_034553 [Stylosanthes scabra]|uniref:WD repeat-containing protein 76 n=1 Tax=Stylosanthes scabra TaxID=79078 RepID=A0ABU6TCJ1_9FABA|nr:hypothetical protein [Stylosanthes scabra]
MRSSRELESLSSMAPPELNDYERRRLENIRRNDEMIAALKLHSKAASLLSKRPSVIAKSEKKLKTETTPVVIRRSLRTRGIQPDSKGLEPKQRNQNSIPNKSKAKSLTSTLIHPSMAPQKLNEYERQRLENIRRNDEKMAALKLHSKASFLSKRPSVTTKSYVVKPEKKPKSETQVVIRCSLRTKGIPPDCKGLHHTSPAKTKGSAKTLGPLPMSDAYTGDDDSDRPFIESIVSMAKKEAQEGELDGRDELRSSFEIGSMDLDPKNIARVVSGKITAMRFFPSISVKMIVAGSELGNLGFWNLGDDEGRVHLYHPHPSPISGILVHPYCLSKIYTSCYDWFIRLMDAEKEIFDMVYSSDEGIYCLHQPKNEANCLYFGEGRGGLTVWDNRMGKCSSSWVLHESRINTIDFKCGSPHILATSSSDGTACTWDLRYANADKVTALKTLTHKNAVHSAYFSPSGCRLATSLDDTIGIYGGTNLEDAVSVYHYNQPGRWLPTFRATWGWDDSYLFIGNMKRGVDVFSTSERKVVTTFTTFRNPPIIRIPCLDAHPNEDGMLAGGTSGGQVYIWTSS